MPEPLDFGRGPQVKSGNPHRAPAPWQAAVPPVDIRARMRTIAAATVLAALLAGSAATVHAATAAHGAPAQETAAAFVTRILREELRGQWTRQWDELHPGHQQLITEAQYVACSRGLATSLGSEVLTVVGVHSTRIRVENVPQQTAKIVAITMRRPGTPDAVTFRIHAVRVDGRWAWILGRPFLQAIAQGRCLDGSPLRHPEPPA